MRCLRKARRVRSKASSTSAKVLPEGIQINAVDGGQAQRSSTTSPISDMPADLPARKLPQGRRASPASRSRSPDGPLDWHTQDWVAFLGASYFRAIGELRQYGLSARGVALDTWQVGREEEFPDFTKFWIGRSRAAR